MLNEALGHGKPVRLDGTFLVGADCGGILLGKGCQLKEGAGTHGRVLAAVLAQGGDGELDNPFGELCPNGGQKHTAVIGFKGVYPAQLVHRGVAVPATIPNGGEMEGGHIHELGGFHIPERESALDSVAHGGFGGAALLESLLRQFFFRHRKIVLLAFLS